MVLTMIMYHIYNTQMQLQIYNTDQVCVILCCVMLFFEDKVAYFTRVNINIAILSVLLKAEVAI